MPLQRDSFSFVMYFIHQIAIRSSYTHGYNFIGFWTFVDGNSAVDNYADFKTYDQNLNTSNVLLPMCGILILCQKGSSRYGMKVIS
jgi:hypothetical protein